MSNFSYVSGERRPVEVLVFRMDPTVVNEFIRIDHDVWTMREAFMDGLARIPFLSKEVWLDDSKPGEVTIVFVWDTQAEWDEVGAVEFQQKLQAEFDARFSRILSRADIERQVAARPEASVGGPGAQAASHGPLPGCS